MAVALTAGLGAAGGMGMAVASLYSAELPTQTEQGRRVRAAGAESDRASFGRQKLTRVCVCVCSPSATAARTHTHCTYFT